MKKVLIIGAGRIAGLDENDKYRRKPCTHAGAFIAHKHFEVIGVCDKFLKKAKNFAKIFNIKRYFNNILDAISETKPHLVVIAVPYKLNYKVIKLIVKSNFKPQKILCEKPIAGTLAEANLIYNLCKKNNISLYVNNRRLNKAYNEFEKIYKKNLNSSGIIVNAFCSSGLNTIGIHMIDILRKIFGEIVSVRSKFEEKKVKKLPYSKNFTNDDPRVNSQILFESGLIGNFINTALTKFTYFEIEVLCRDGKLRISDNGDKLELFKIAKPTKSTISYKLKAPVLSIIKETNTLFFSVAQSLADSKIKWKNHPLCSKEALESYKVLDAMIRSAKTQKVVYIKN